jgi:hypothetical protein
LNGARRERTPGSARHRFGHREIRFHPITDGAASGGRDKDDLRIIKRFMVERSFAVLPLSENVGHRALVYIEEYGLSSGLRAADAIIAATAVENAMVPVGCVSGSPWIGVVMRPLNLLSRSGMVIT